MIKKCNNWEKTQAAKIGSFEKLPAGGYEAKIIGAKVVDNANGGQRLEIAVDIKEGKLKNYFKNQLARAIYDDKKWKGRARFCLAVDDGSQKDNFKKSLLKAVTQALEQSNARYRWDWDETKLKGLKVGIMVRDKEYDFVDQGGNNVHGFCAEIFEFVDIKLIQEGKFSVPEPKYLNGKAPSAPDAPPMPSDSDAPPATDDYPF